MNAEILFLFAILLPLIGGMFTYLFRKSAYALVAVLLAFIASLFLFNAGTLLSRWEWLPQLEMGWRIDQMAALLIALVLFISLLVHVFSVAYMRWEEHPRYFLKLGFFTSAMIGLLAADHLILLFIFWELVGFASYLLIGFWHKDTEAATSGKWAFMTNRLADVALLAAIIVLGTTDTFFMSEVNSQVGFWVAVGLLVGAMGKSAQFPFSGWLPRAMTGPTPVSALIHAATMVAAGVYLLLRLGPFFPDSVLNSTAVIGVFTAFVGAFVAVTKHDIKQVLAYSTISQLGYMFLAIGVRAFDSAFFHLWTHAFFKAGLFLIAGVIIHHVHTQDMRRMGGLADKMKWLMPLHVVVGLALAGMPLLSGFMSKEGILQGAWHWAEGFTLVGFSEAHIVTYVAFFGIFLTTWYICRQIWLVYFTPSRSTEPVLNLSFEPHMGVPVMLLAILSLWIFHGLNPFSAEGYVSAALTYTHGNHAFAFIPYLSAGLVVVGILHSYGLFGPRRFYVQHYSEITQPPSLVGQLSFNGLYLDRGYQELADGYVRMCAWLYWIDKKIVDGLVNGVGVVGVVLSKVLALVDRYVVDGTVHVVVKSAEGIGWLFTRTQARQAQNQILWLLTSLLLLFLLFLFL